MMSIWKGILCGLCLLLAACATSPTGRSQLILVDDASINRMGAQAFQQLQEELQPSENAEMRRQLNCVADALIAVLDERHLPARWDVRLFANDAANAFALPGGYIGVYEGLFNVARDQHQLAAVIGHEIGHVTARHAAERVSRYQTTDFALQVLGGLGGTERTAALLGLGAQVGVLLPFDRTQESEADQLGLSYMARAGFDPRGAIALWRNMAAQRNGAAPEFLSTHPSSQRRIAELERAMPQAMAQYEAARAAGRRPACD
jgi:predicted Zn-dependent protease